MYQVLGERDGKRVVRQDIVNILATVSSLYVLKPMTNVGNENAASSKREPVARNRVQVVLRPDGTSLYCTSWWCGWKELSNTFIVVMILLFFLGVFGIIWFQARHFIQTAENQWLQLVLAYVFMGALSFSSAGVFAVCLLFFPYVLILQLSSKQVWISDGILYRRASFLGKSWVLQVPFDQIDELKVQSSGHIFQLTVRYERRLPDLLEAILNNLHITKRQWRTTLLNAFSIREEAQWVCDRLTEEITSQPGI